MMQGFYMLALARARRQRRIAALCCAAALVSAGFAAHACLDAPAVAASTAALPYVAQVEDNRLIVSRGGTVVIRTEIDARSLPAADREALEQGVVLSDAEALAKLLEDYS